MTPSARMLKVAIFPAFLLIAFAEPVQAQTAEAKARVRQKSIESATERLTGKWQLEKIEFATPEGYFRTEMNNTKGSECVFTISKNTIRSKTVGGGAFPKERPDDEIFNETSVLDFGDEPEELLTVKFTGVEENKPKEFVFKFRYQLNGDELAMVIDFGNLKEFPESTDLKEGKKVGRTAWFLKRIK